MKLLNVSATLDSLKAIRNYVAEAAKMAGLDTKRTYRLCVAVDEIATNAITHGYAASGTQGLLDVWATIDDQTLTITLEDTAAAYDPSAHVAQDLALPVEQREAGGLGLFLASHNVDQFLYERIGDRNRHTFVVHRPQGIDHT
jgi:anti-sigma regulatory factor (Ser/Thr protein kinase)